MPVVGEREPGLAERLIRRRSLVVAVWAVLLPVLLYAGARLQDRMEASARLEGSESARVEDVLAGAFASPFAHSLLLVVRGLPEGPAYGSVLTRLADSLTAVRGVTAVETPLTVQDTLLSGGEPGAAVVLVGFERSRPADSLLVSLRRVTDMAARNLATAAPGLTLRWTGMPALSQDLREVSAGAAHEAEVLALPLVLVLLLVAFRSVVAAVLPLLFGVLAIGAGMGAALLLAIFGTPSILLGNVVSVLGLALGIDYSLLMVTRFREALARDAGAGSGAGRSAAVESLRGAGHTILISGSTVMLGFAGLLLVPIAELRSVGLGGLAVSAVAVALGTTLLPAILSWVGPRIDRLALPGSGRRMAGTGGAPPSRWMAWGRFVTARPAPVVILATVPMALLAWPALRLSSSAPREDWLPREMESVQALRDLDAIGRASLPSTLPVLLDLGAVHTSVGDRWSVVEGVAERIEADSRVARVQSLPGLARRYGATPGALLAVLPENVRSRLVTDDREWTRLDVTPVGGLGPGELSELVRDLRGLDEEPRAPPGLTLLVGGMPAFQTDYEDAVRRSAPLVVAIVMLSILVVLAVGFRSVLVPLKATVLNLLTVGAGLGSLVLVFQDGLGASLLGVTPLSGIFPAVPIMAFCVVFGLSMDYEVFLVGRIAELRAAHPERSEREVIVEGVARTGRVITFAAAMMVVIFAAFATVDYLPSRLFGFALAVAVLTDATLVRLAIGPALLRIAGRWNWWPGDARAEPRGRQGASGLR